MFRDRYSYGKPEVTIYGLKIDESWFVCNPSERFAPSYGHVTEKRLFQVCLEDYLQACEGECQLPQAKYDPWTFWKSDSEEELREGKGEMIVTLHSDDKDALWELKQWVSGPCTILRIRVDY